MKLDKKISVYPILEEKIALEGDNSKEDKTFEHITKLPFWCQDDHLHEREPNYRDRWCCLTHRVGLARIRNQEMALADFQVEFCSEVMNHARKKSKDLPLLMHINKGRQMGFTEIVLRLIQYFCFNRYAGGKVGIIAATSGDLAKEDIRRLYQLFVEGVPEALSGPMVNDTITLKNGTTIRAFKASEEAMTGFTKFSCIFMDEAAKWKLNDDKPIFDSIMPIIRVNASDLFLVSTPKGRVKMFYKIHKNPGKFIKFRYPIERAIGSLHTQETIQELVNTTVEDPAQEYHCQFESNEDSIFRIGENDQEPFQELKLYDSWSEEDSYYETPIEA